MTFNWKKARNPEVRDLGWALFSPAVINGLPPQAVSPWQVEFDLACSELFNYWDNNPTSLRNFIENLGDKRQGAYFEALWAFFLNEHPRYDLLAHNLVVEENGVTKGSLDLIFRDNKEQQVIHAELAVKFYLYLANANSNPLGQMIGPNPDDSLDVKIHHLQSHQIPLSSAPETLSKLKKSAIPNPTKRIAIVRGRLFYPVGWQGHWHHELVNPNHLTGRWLYQQDLTTLLENAVSGSWQIIEKKDGFMPGAEHAKSSRQLGRIIAEQFSVLKHPMLIRHLLSEDWLDNPYYFVVPDSWPQHP
jgi:hypothetical protein